ncbi:MAG: hypothetical protein ACLQE9_12450 [Roseiarcus sp.]
MSWEEVDDFSNPAAWVALQPDGVTASTQIVVAPDLTRVAPGFASSLRMAVAASSDSNILRRDFAAPLDLTAFDELRLTFASDRVATGAPAAPFYLELRMGSAAAPIASAGNLYFRQLPVAQTGVFDVARLSLADLAPSVRSAINRLELRVAGNLSFNCNLEFLGAARDQMLADVDAALLNLLNGRLTVGAAAVPAVLHPANGTLTQARPYFQILHLDTIFSNERTEANRSVGDYAGTKSSVRPRAFAFELLYQVTAVADDRATQAAMLDFALQTLPTRGSLFVNGYLLPAEMVFVPPRERIGAERTDEVPLFYRISTRQETGAPTSVVPTTGVVMQGDLAN